MLSVDHPWTEGIDEGVVQTGAQRQECLGKARAGQPGICGAMGKRAGESKTRARQGGMQRWSRAQLYGWRCSGRAKRRAKRALAIRLQQAQD